MFYTLAQPELTELLAAAERLLAATGQQISLCPNYGIRARRRLVPMPVEEPCR